MGAWKNGERRNLHDSKQKQAYYTETLEQMEWTAKTRAAILFDKFPKPGKDTALAWSGRHLQQKSGPDGSKAKSQKDGTMKWKVGLYGVQQGTWYLFKP